MEFNGPLWYSDQAMGYMTDELGARFLAGARNFPSSSAFRPVLQSIHFSGYRGVFIRGLGDWGLKLTTHFLTPLEAVTPNLPYAFMAWYLIS